MIHGNLGISSTSLQRNTFPMHGGRPTNQPSTSMQSANDMLNAIMMDAAVFATYAGPQANDLAQTLTNMQFSLNER